MIVINRKYYFVFFKDGTVLQKTTLEEINEFLRDEKVPPENVVKAIYGIGLGRRIKRITVIETNDFLCNEKVSPENKGKDKKKRLVDGWSCMQRK